MMIKDPTAIRQHYAQHRADLARAIHLVQGVKKTPTDAVVFAVRHGLPIWAVKVAIRNRQDGS